MLDKVSVGPNFRLGTAQLGLNYGVTNQKGLLTEKAAYDLILRAVQSGCMRFDTARAYGLAENRLGNFLAQKKVSADIVTKLDLSDAQFDSPFIRRKS